MIDEMNHLKEYRIKRLMTQKELAAAAGVSQVTISFIENQLCHPMALTKEKLARALKVDADKIFPESED